MAYTYKDIAKGAFTFLQRDLNKNQHGEHSVLHHNTLWTLRPFTGDRPHVRPRAPTRENWNQKVDKWFKKHGEHSVLVVKA